MQNPKKSEVVITVNTQQPVAAVRAMQKELDKLEDVYTSLINAGKGGSEKAKKIKQEMDELSGAIKVSRSNMEKAQQVVQNLASSSLSQLNMALRAVKKEMGRVSSDSPKLDELRQKYKAINDQISIMKGTLLDVKKGSEDLANQSDKWLSRAIAQQKDSLEKTRESTEEYREQKELLIGLMNEQGRRAMQTVKSGGASIDDLRKARTDITSFRDMLGGDFQRLDGNTMNYIKQVNDVLKEIDRQIDAISGKEEEVVKTTEEVAQAAEKIALDPSKFSPNEIKEALDETKQKLSEISMTDPARGRLLAGAKKLQAALDGVDKELVDIEVLLKPENLSKASFDTLQKASKQLEKEINQLERDTEEYADKRKQLEKLRQEVDRINGKVKEQGFEWQNAGKKLAAYLGLYKLFDMARQKLQQIVTGNLALSDAMAGVRKVTGFTNDEVNELTTNLAKIDTRSTLEQLNEIAEAGGRMGLAKYGIEGMEEFVRAANQIQVALGDDLGDDAILPLAKLAENFGLMKSMGVENSMLAIGSAINELGATSTAQGSHIVDFTNRLQATGSMAKLTTDQILALGSTMDASGLSAETSATAFSKFLVALNTNTKGIESSLGITKGTLTSFIEQGNTMQAILTVLDKMHEKGNLRALGGVFKELGGSGDKMVSTFGKLSQNVEMLREHLNVSKEAFEEHISITNEFNNVEQTAQGLIERANNMWQNAFVNPEGVDMVKEMAQQWYNLSVQMTHSETTMQSIKTTLTLLGGAVKILLQILPLLVRMLMFYGVVAAIQKVYVSFMALRTGILAAKTAQEGLNVAMKSNLFGLIISLVATAITYLIDYANAADEAAEKQKSVNNALAEAQSEYMKQVKKLDDYIKALESANLADETRQKLIRSFNNDYKIYLDKLGLEIKNVNDLKGAYQQLNEEIKKKAYFEMRERTMDTYVGESRDKQAQAMINFQQVMKKYGINANADMVVNNQHLGSTEAAFKVLQTSYPYARYEKNHRFVNDDPEDAISLGADGLWTRAVRSTPLIVNTRDMDIVEEVVTAVDDIIKAYRETSDREKEVHAAFDGLVGDWDKDFQSLIGDTNNDGGGNGGGGGGGGLTDKELKAQWQRDMQQAQQEAKNVITNIRNFYQRQVTEVLRAANEQNWDTEMTDAAVRVVNTRMNLALSNARRALAGIDNDWEEFKATMAEDMREQADEVGYNESQALLNGITNIDLNGVRDRIIGLARNLRVSKDVAIAELWRGSTQDQQSNEQAELKRRQEVNKRLLERDYTGKVNRDYTQTFEAIGAFSPTNEQMTTLLGADADAAQALAKKRTDEILQVLQNAREHVNELFALDVEQDEGRNKMMEILFGADWQNGDSELKAVFTLYGDDLKVFYNEMLKYTDAFTEAQKKAYEESKRIADSQFENSPFVQKVNNAANDLQDESRTQKRFGDDQSFGQQLGLTWNIDNDPEVLRYQLLAEKAELYYAKMKTLRAQDKISAKQLTDAQRQMMEAQADMADKMAQKVSERVNLLQQFSAPLATFAEGMGEYFESLNDDAVDSNQKLKNLLKEMILAYGKMMIQMAAQDMTRRVTKKLYQQQELADETTHRTEMLAIQEMYQQLMLASQVQFDATRLGQKTATDATELADEGTKAGGLIPLGIAEGAAKIIGTLGFWGIPLIAVISALLMGLLSWALSAAFGSSDSGGGAETGPNVKLATGMLTYDAGNTQSVAGGGSKSYGGLATISGDGDAAPVLGTDGKVYNARHVDKLTTGIVTEPIATMVNGQPAIVGEKGPEIVIGRETLAAMMMARPDLIAEIVKFDRNYSGRQYRTYDSGNLGEIDLGDGSETPPIGLTSEDMAMFYSVMTRLADRLDKGINASVNKYGRGGLAESAVDGANFMRTNSGDRIWRRDG